jgi:hypothetical protein
MGPDGSLRIRHRELVVENIINAGTDQQPPISDGTFRLAKRKGPDGAQVEIGNAGTFWLNPGNKLVFPWLSQLATNFGYYKMRGCAFEFRSNSSSSTVSQAIGSVVFMTELDVYRGAPNGSGANSLKTEVTSQQYVNMGKPSENFLHGIECARHLSQTTLFCVRQGKPIIDENPGDQLPLRGDERLSYVGYTQIYIGGVQAPDPQSPNTNPALGDVYVTYDIELFRPLLGNQIKKGANENASTSSFQNKMSFYSPYFNPMADSATNQPFGLWDKYGLPFNFTTNTLNVIPQYGLLLGANDERLNPSTVNGFVFPASQEDFLATVSFNWTGPTNTTVNPGKLYAIGGLTFLRAYENKTQYYEGNANEVDTRLRVDFLVKVTGGTKTPGFFTRGEGTLLPHSITGPLESSCNFELIIQHAAPWWTGVVDSSDTLVF